MGIGAVHQDHSTMKLIDTLQDEHVLIDRVLGSFRTYVDGLLDGTADPDDGRRFAAFFTEFAGHFVCVRPPPSPRRPEVVLPRPTGG